MKKLVLIVCLWMADLVFAFQPVDINQASAEQLSLLPGVGDKLAHDMVAHRMKKGPFLSKEELLSIAGLNTKKLDLMREHIVVGKGLVNKKAPPAVLTTLALKPPPDFSQLLEQVIKAQGLEMAVDDSLSNRVRKAAWLPTLRAGFAVDQERMMAEKTGDKGRDSLLSRGGRDIGFSVGLIFDLDKLVFNRDELEVKKLTLKRLEVREEVIKKAHQAYFSYMRLYQSAQKPVAMHEANKITIELSEFAAQLDAMSNGAFSRLSEVND